MTTLPADELVERLRDDYENWSLGGTGPELLRQAADALFTQAATIEAQAAELSSLRAKLAEAMEARDKQMDYAIDLQRIIEDLCGGRPIREPKTTARHHFNMAVEFQRAARRLIEENGNG